MSNTTGIPNSFTPPGVYVNLTVKDSPGGDTSFKVLVLGQAASGSAYETNPALYSVTSLSQLAVDFGKTSDNYQIISGYKDIDISTSIYALNCISGEVQSTVSNGTIIDINSVLLTTTQSTDMAGTGVAATGGSGSGATFDITSTKNEDGNAFTPASVKINSGGLGYKVGDKLTVANVGTITVISLDSETITEPEGDATTLKNALANVGNIAFDIIIGTYNSSEAIQAIDTYLTETWSFSKELYGQYFTINQNNNVQQLFSDAPRFNKKSCVVTAIPEELNLLQTLGSSAAQIAVRTQQNPSLPLRSFPLNTGTVSPANRWDVATRNALYENGYCTVVCDAAGNATLERTRIGATTDAEGEAINDVSLETIFQAVYCAKVVRAGLLPYITNPYVIVDDDDIGYTNPSVWLLTPSMVTSTCINIYQGLIGDLVAKDIDTFKKNLVVSLDSSVNGRIDINFPVTLTSGLNQITINLSVEK